MADIYSTHIAHPKQFRFEDRLELPQSQGLYALVVDSVVNYVGMSQNIRSRISGHMSLEDMREAARNGRAVVIACWLMPEMDRKQVGRIENRIHRSGCFIWGNDGETPSISACGMIDDAHSLLSACGECRNLRRMQSEVSQLETTLWWTITAAREAGILHEFDRKDVPDLFRKHFGESGQKIVDLYERKLGEYKSISQHHAAMKQKTLEEWIRANSLTIEDVGRIIQNSISNELDA